VNAPPDPVEPLDARHAMLAVRAQPGAKKAGCAGIWNGMLKIKVSSPAQDGRANEDLVEWLAHATGLSRSDVVLVRGLKSREKRFRLALPADELRARLEPLLRGT